MGNISSLKRISISGGRKMLSSGVDGFFNGDSSGSLRSLFGFSESHSGLSFTITTFGIFFSFFEQHHSGKRKSISITFTTFELRSTSRVFTN
jgi:hypothetical protein